MLFKGVEHKFKGAEHKFKAVEHKFTARKHKKPFEGETFVVQRRNFCRTERKEKQISKNLQVVQKK